MKTISLHQPWASLCVTRQPCDCRPPGHYITCQSSGTFTPPSMVKRFIDSDRPCRRALIGQPLIFHATKRVPYNLNVDYQEPTVGEWQLDWRVDHDSEGFTMWRSPEDRDAGRDILLPLGAIVGSGRIAACYPIVDASGCKNATAHVCRVNESLIRHTPLDSPEDGQTEFIISDQIPYGDWSPGRYAWMIEDAAPTTERCPLALGGGHVYRPGDDCPVCDGAGRCDPIPARGHQKIWNWEPTRPTPPSQPTTNPTEES